MDTTTIIGITAASIGSSTLTIGEDGDISLTGRQSIVATSLTSTATTAIGDSLNANAMKEIQTKYSSAYIESMSEEELESALQKLDLLVVDDCQDHSNKAMK